nr:hypothetical protein CFP56_76226 [Quercus suber]POF16348.1 hypothetical protein CFP56_23866 [Quercus suber]
MALIRIASPRYLEGLGFQARVSPFSLNHLSNQPIAGAGALCHLPVDPELHSRPDQAELVTSTMNFTNGPNCSS